MNTDKRWTSPYMGVTIVYGGAPDEGNGRLVTYDPADELLATRAELARLRQVEQLAIELARMVNFEVTIIGNGGPYAGDVLSRCRKLGLLEAK